MQIIASLRRHAALATTGVLVAIVSIGLLVFFAMRISAKTVTLAARLDPQRTLIFIREAKKEDLLADFSVFRPLLGSSVPAAAAIKDADLYEFAVLRHVTGNGLSWVMYSHNKEEGSHETVVSENDPSLFLPLEDIQKSIYRTPFFARNIKNSHTSVVWTAAEHLLTTRQSVLKSLVGADKHVLLTGRGELRGDVIIEDTDWANGEATAPVALGSKNLLSLTIANPALFLSGVKTALTHTDPAFAEGAEGIAKFQLATLLPIDSASLSKALFSKPVEVSIRKGSGSTANVFLLRGHADPKAVAMLREEMQGTGTNGTIRNLSFAQGENTRVDIVPGNEDASTAVVSGWKIESVGRFVLAVQGTQYILSTDAEVVEGVLMSGTQPEQARQLLSASIESNWLNSVSDLDFPLLGDELREVMSLLGQPVSRLSVLAHRRGPDTVVTWGANALLGR